MVVIMQRGGVLWAGVILLSGLAWVNGEMRKSWKVKTSDSGDSLSSAVWTPPQPGEFEHVLAKMSRFEREPVEQEARVEEIEAVPSEKESEEPPKQDELPTEAEVKPTVKDVPVKNRLRSTYVAKKNPSVYNSVRESVKAAPFMEDHGSEIQIDDFSADEIDEDEYDLGLEDNQVEQKDESGYEEGYKMIEGILEEVKSTASDEKPGEKEEPQNEAETDSKTEEMKQYDFGPVLNMTIDEPNNIVNVKLNEQVLKDIFTGRQRGGGGVKKMWKYAMPLFILPFLIQSAIIPFMLTTVKLFLFKSFMAGKLAIFLLLLGAFKNFTSKKDKEVYVKDLPERRYEPYTEWPYPYHSEGKNGWNN
ncbi:uncharacterized protein LOC109416385 [Aedes albopictus]|uniref:Osiris n=1 Tax=Aedes albopictus TaxID=7160 RepID=A0ABM1XMM9_AEDAL|nr:uncharacterized protein LOC109416385 [Aedes albopictus]XP_029730234.1 uncharacterized protein LOC115267390 [Aedes albopictus]